MKLQKQRILVDIRSGLADITTAAISWPDRQRIGAQTPHEAKQATKPVLPPRCRRTASGVAGHSVGDVSAAGGPKCAGSGRCWSWTHRPPTPRIDLGFFVALGRQVSSTGQSQRFPQLFPRPF